MKITIELTDEQVRALALLGRVHIGRPIPIGPPEEAQAEWAEIALWHLVSSAADGVRRPGAWERHWLYSAFGSEWEADLEPYGPVSEYSGRPLYTRPRE